MSSSYTSNVKLAMPAIGDTGWSVPVNGNCATLDGLAPVGGLVVTTTEVPSATSNVRVAPGTFVKPDGSIGAFAGSASQAITASTTQVLYLDGTASWALIAASSYPVTPHIRLATVTAGASTITAITDDRQCFPVCGASCVSDTDGATITFDLSLGLNHQVTLGGNRALALGNPSVGDVFRIVLSQDATGSRTVTWFSGIRWPGGSAPTLTTTASKADSFEFICISTGVYLSLNKSQNL